ncbi:Spy/CpxP family protein refolding chaperone [Bowmanella dokdonensis]|uniref:Spy/CpxP family protein refolding chaperone n=1 Tax=Bowmanella dokdonensis TaxID=751969 RepID=A0A939DJC4_9ALTE|nr:Spy/CpxP family protein refolding chaperone [Bowmanella dokdonensis]MBN7823789.1 Spy/CpxP family protein refolding chaperone [Bowmanella dokdonensis]
MKSLQKSLMALTLGLILVGPAQAHPPQDPEGIHKVLEQLDLSRQQRQDIRQLLKQQRAQRQALKPDRQAEHQAISQLVQAQSWDPDQATLLLQRTQQDRRQAMWQKALLQQQIWNLLNAGQQQAWQAQVQSLAPRTSRQVHREHMIDRLKLNDDQQQALAALQAEQEVQRQQKQANHLAFRTAQLALLQQGEFSEASWNALYSRHEDGFLSSAVQELAFRHQFYQLLNDEQREQLAQHRERMQGRGHKGGHPARRG